MRACYKIYVAGRLGPELQHALADLRPEVEGPNTLLSTDAVDQAELRKLEAVPERSSARIMQGSIREQVVELVRILKEDEKVL